MQTKGKGSKVLVAICKDRSRLLTFPRGDWSQGQRNKARKGSMKNTLLPKAVGCFCFKDRSGLLGRLPR